MRRSPGNGWKTRRYPLASEEAGSINLLVSHRGREGKDAPMVGTKPIYGKRFRPLLL
jgi:hypothetical protein